MRVSDAMANRNISIPLGIIIGLVASFIQSLGLTIQRKSHVLNQHLPQHEQRAEHRRPLWLLGFAVFISSNVLGSLVQIASLPVVILAPLGAVSLLWNAFFARFLLGDVFSPWMILGTFLIAGGAVLIAVFGIVPEPTRSLEDLLELFSRPLFVVYFSLLAVTVAVFLVITHITEYSLARYLAASAVSLPADPDLVTDVTTPNTEALTTERTPLLDRKSPVHSPSPSLFSFKRPVHHLPAITHRRLLIAVSYASISGIISGMCLLFAKSGVELLMLTLGGHNQFWRWQAWMLVIGLVVFAVVQLWYLHKALILANPTLVCPSAFCFYNLSSIVNGLVYFDQFSLIPPMYLLLVTVGIVILLGGVWVVSIQTGGGGVDVGTWNGSDSDGEEIEGEGGMERVVVSGDEGGNEDVISEENGRQQRETRSEFDNPSSGTTRRVTSPLPSEDFLSPSSPQHASTSTIGRHKTRYHQRGNIDMYTYPTQSLTQLSPIGTGFQIGLSPVSPGFVLVPTERRKRVGGKVGERRRTVSEGV